MKRSLNAALIIALAITAEACTVVTDPSSGSSASTGGPSNTALMDRHQQVAEFANANLERLRNDMAVGQGEYLASLAVLLDIDVDHQPAFFALTRDQFTRLFPNEHPRATEMLAALDQEMRADPRFGRRLALN